MMFNTGSCADLGGVGTMLFVFGLPGSTLSSIVTAAIKEVGSVVTWGSVQNTVESPEFVAFQKTLMRVLAPSSRGFTKVS